MASSQYASIATLFKALSYVANGSRDHSSGFHKFITFGLPDKISYLHSEAQCYKYMTCVFDDLYCV